MSKKLFIPAVLIVLSSFVSCTSKVDTATWKHLSTVNDDLPVPNSGNQQTATAILDVDKDGINDFIITERTQAPSVLWYRRTADGWTRYVVDKEALHIEAGSAVHDIDADGDLDVVFGGDSKSSGVWWWENPYPEFDPDTPWKRRAIKNFGANKHHDQIFGDFDGDGQEELVFWNQDTLKLYLAEIPTNPKKAEAWEVTEIYYWSRENEPPQRGEYPSWKSPNEHEGLAKADIDGDGKLEIIGGGRWFKHNGGTDYIPNIIDDGYAFSRSAAGQLIKGGRPEVVLVVGDGVAPLMLYEWKDSTWVSTELIDKVQDGHSLAILDFNVMGTLTFLMLRCGLGKTQKPKPESC